MVSWLLDTPALLAAFSVSPNSIMESFKECCSPERREAVSEKGTVVC